MSSDSHATTGTDDPRRRAEYDYDEVTVPDEGDLIEVVDEDANQLDVPEHPIIHGDSIGTDVGRFSPLLSIASVWPGSTTTMPRCSSKASSIVS